MRILTAISKWFAHRKHKREVTKAARAVLSGESSDEARAIAAGIVDAVANRKSICSSCLNPFEYRERPWEMWFQYRSTLMIPDSAANPMVCDHCFETAITSFNRQATNVGTRNDGHANLALRYLN